MKDEWECIDLRCTHYDGDRCTLGFCEPDILKGAQRVTYSEAKRLILEEYRCLDDLAQEVAEEDRK